MNHGKESFIKSVELLCVIHYLFIEVFYVIFAQKFCFTIRVMKHLKQVFFFLDDDEHKLLFSRYFDKSLNQINIYKNISFTNSRFDVVRRF